MADADNNNTTAASGDTTQQAAEYIKIKVVGQVLFCLSKQ